MEVKWPIRLFDLHICKDRAPCLRAIAKVVAAIDCHLSVIDISLAYSNEKSYGPAGYGGVVQFSRQKPASKAKFESIEHDLNGGKGVLL